MQRAEISAAVITTNNEGTIKRTLESLEWVDEIVVVDGHSSDSTPVICQSYENVSFHQHPFQGHIEQKNLALQKTRHSWVLCVDSDEEISPELRKDIEGFIKNGEAEKFSACRFPRRSFHLGRWIDHGGWYPDRKIRFLNKEKGGWQGVNPHDIIRVNGEVKELRGDLIHNSFEDLFDQIKTNNYLSSAAALALYRNKVGFSFTKLMFKPVGKFIETWIVKRGFMDGLPGFVIAVGAAYSMFLKHAKLWELESIKSREDGGKYPVDR